MPSDYEPLHERFAIDRDVLHDGVPVWLADDLERVLRHLLDKLPMLDGALQRTFQLDLRGHQMSRKDVLLDLSREDGELLLDFLNCALGFIEPGEPSFNKPDLRNSVVLLDHLLHEGNSVWRARWNGHTAGLERRVDPTVQQLADAAMTDSSSVAVCLRRAWAATYGREGDPDKAMAQAILALEAALCPLVIPDDASPTLGKALSSLRDAPQRFQLPLAPPGPDQNAVAALAATVGMVWRTHQRHVDREGNASGNSSAEAEAAVHVALTVTHLARADLFTRAD